MHDTQHDPCPSCTFIDNLIFYKEKNNILTRNFKFVKIFFGIGFVKINSNIYARCVDEGIIISGGYNARQMPAKTALLLYK